VQGLKKALMERMLEAEMTDHVGYAEGERQTGGHENNRNGGYDRTVHTESGPVTVKMPRDRNGTFAPKLLPKHRRRLEGFDEKVLGLYARGMSQRDIQSMLSEYYGAEVSQELISEVTDSVLDLARAWQQRPLDSVYPIVYLDALFTPVRIDGTVQKRACYLAIGVTVEGRREPLGLWMETQEGAKFWLSVLTDLKNRGVSDIFFVCCDGLSGFPQAVEAAFPKTVVQTCIVHLLRQSLRFVSATDQKKVTAALKTIYDADTEPLARKALDAFDAEWGGRYPAIPKSWRQRWDEICPFLAYPREIRRIVYTTNAIESAISQIRKYIRPKGHFPNDDAVLKMIYLTLTRAELKWRPSRDWRIALTHFSIVFADRMPA
jgi:putative transposase